METDKIYQGDSLGVLKTFEDNSIDCCVTSPPFYALRNYGVNGQIGLEETPEKYIERLTEVFMEVYRIFKPNGTLWLNIGDSYNGSGGNHKEGQKNDTGFQGALGVRCGGKGARVKWLKPKDLIGVPWLLAFSLRNAGWYLRQDIIWAKNSCMPESVKDRCTKSHEYIFLMSKSQKYYFDYESIQEEGISDSDYPVRNKRDVWTINPKSNKEAHFATYPQELIAPCILAGCPEGGVVLDPFMGSGTTGLAALKLGRRYIGIELNENYIDIANKRLATERQQLKLF